ncbi:MAG: HTH-type transcriptional regulator KipR [Chloroflexi bacterium]|nr:HTH-type transcriptional regulator KipR [Chloroflexota bacterium]
MADAKILAKGLKLLEELAQSARGKTALELAQLIDVHKTNVYRYLDTLIDARYIKSDGDGHYHLGNKILELGSQILRRMPLREAAHPLVVKLSADTQMIVHLCVLDGPDVIYIDKVETQRSLPVISRIGSRASAYCTAVGKALLSGLPTDRVVSLLREFPPVRKTAATITDPLQVLEEIKVTAERGYAIDNGEHEEGISCFAAPIRGYGGDIVGAISLTGLKREFADEEAPARLIAAVTKTAAEISRELGYAGRRGT